MTSFKDIDEALLRPGRCFGILETRNLVKKEAQNLADKLGIELVHKKEGSSYSLAEIYKQKENLDISNRGF